MFGLHPGSAFTAGPREEAAH